jgi:SAM-dependent methyltransferase
MPKDTNVFDRSGLAVLSDLKNQEWKNLIAFLEKEQNFFTSQEFLFRSPEYKWPRDPLHTWSRIWEYPYVYYHLRKIRTNFQKEELPKVMDLGSGVTFFPFSAAKLGYNIICGDIDPVCEKDLNRAIGVISQKLGKVEFKLIADASLPFKDQEFDIVYSISVLEHIDKPDNSIIEIARVLKPGGLLLLTIDLDLKGNSGIGLMNYQKLLKAINNYFDYLYPDITIHPIDMLLSDTGPYPLRVMSNIDLIWYLGKQWLFKPLLLKKPCPIPTQYHLAVQGFILSKKVR